MQEHLRINEVEQRQLCRLKAVKFEVFRLSNVGYQNFPAQSSLFLLVLLDLWNKHFVDVFSRTQVCLFEGFELVAPFVHNLAE